VPSDPIRDVESFDAYRAALRNAVTAVGKDAPTARSRKVQFLHRRRAQSKRHNAA
jgi:hypothetical protein